MRILKKSFLIFILSVILVISCKPEAELFVLELINNQVFDNANPTITWLAPAKGVSYEYRLDGSAWIELKKDVTELTFSNKLADGRYHFEIRVVDADKKVYSPKSITFIVDTSFVDIPQPQGIALSAMGFTSNVRPQITWERVGIAVGYRVSINDGEWEVFNSPNKLTFIPRKDLKDGVYVFKVCALNSNGKWSEPGIITITIGPEPEAPPIIISALTPTNNPRPQWSWSASFSEDNPLTRYRYQLDDENPDNWEEIDIHDGNPSASFTPNFDLGDGVHTLYVQALDSFENWTNSKSFSVTIDTKPPAKPKISGLALTNNTSPVWTWTYVDASDVAKIQYRIDGNLWLEHAGNGLTSYQLDEFLGDREYKFFLKVADALGNWSEEASFTTVIDTSLPDFVELNTDITPVNGEYISSNARPTLYWNVPSGVFGFRFQMQNNYDEANPLSWTEVGISVTSYTPDTDLADGFYTFYVQARNELGSWGGSSHFSIGVDTTPPTTPILSGITPTGSKQPTWTWNYNSNVDKYLVRLIHGTVQNYTDPINSYIEWGHIGEWEELAGNVVSYTPSVPLATIPPQGASDYFQFPYKLEIKAFDEVANISPIADYVIIIDTKTLPPPIYSGVARTNQAVGFSYEWTWTTSTEFPSSQIKTFEYQIINANNPNFIDDDAAYTDLNGEIYSLQVDLTEGVNKLYLRGIDYDDFKTALGELVVVLDTIGPDKAIITGEEYSNSNQLSWSWNVPAGTFSFQYRVVWSGNMNSSWITQNDTSVLSYYFDPVAEIAYTFELKALDDLGNVSSVASFVTVHDVTPPSAPVVTGPPLTDQPRPTWVWTMTDDWEKFEVELNHSAEWIVVEALEYRPTMALAQGSNTLKVCALDRAGNRSAYGSYTIIVDLDPPLAPVFKLETPTSDRTPMWMWEPNPSDPGDVVGYRYRLGNTGNWVEVDASVTSYEVEVPLEWGDYILYLVAMDKAGNYSSEVQGLISVQDGALHTGLPKTFAFESVSEGKINSAVRLEWIARDDCYEGIAGYELERREYLAAEGVIIPIDPASFVDKKFENGTYVYYDKTAQAGISYMYRIRGINDDVTGIIKAPWSDMSTESLREKLRGSILYAPINGSYTVPSSNPDLLIEWSEVKGANYRILRAGPFTETKSSSELDTVTWYYMKEGTSVWIEYNQSIKLETTKTIITNSFLDENFTEFPLCYYRIYAVAREKDSIVDQEGIISGKYNVTEDYREITGLLYPDNIDSWLTVSDNDMNFAGKIELKINVPAPYNSFINFLDFEIDRTYRWGGGYQGHNATRTDKSSHTSLTNPNPLTTPMEKTITLEYDTRGVSFVDGKKVVYDTLYDTDSNGDKLIAVRMLNHEYDGEIGPVNIPMFYERTQAQIDADSSNYEVIVDPDGAPSEHEWHYLKWDWIVRKTGATTKDNATNFDINLMTRADYSIRLIDASTDAIIATSTGAKYGWPALSPREFAYMTLFFKDVAFGPLLLTYADAQATLSISTVPTSDVTENGWISGQICAHDNKVELVGSKIKTNIFTTDDMPVYNFPNVGLTVVWKPWYMILGAYGGKSFDNTVISISTPKWTGIIILNGDVYMGTFYHGVDTGFTIRVNYLSHNDTVEFYMPADKKHLGDYSMIHEYLNDGYKVHRADGNNANNFIGRFTSVNWRPYTAGRVYPGF